MLQAPGMWRCSVIVSLFLATFAARASAQGCRSFDCSYELVCVQACPSIEAEVLNRLKIGDVYRLYRSQTLTCASGPPNSCTHPMDDTSGGYIEYVFQNGWYINGWVDVDLIDPMIPAPPGTRVYLKLRQVEGCLPEPVQCSSGGTPTDPTICLATPWLFITGENTPHPTDVFEFTGPGHDPGGCSEDHRQIHDTCSVSASINANLLCPGEQFDLNIEICNVTSAAYGGCIDDYTWKVGSMDESIVQIVGPKSGTVSDLLPLDGPGAAHDEACGDLTVPITVSPSAPPGANTTLVVEVEVEGAYIGTHLCSATVDVQVAPLGSSVCSRIDVVFVPANYSWTDLQRFWQTDVPLAIEEFKQHEPFKTYFDYFAFHYVVGADPSAVPNPYEAPDVDEIVYIWNGFMPSGATAYAAQCSPGPAFCPPAPGNGISTIVSSAWLGTMMLGIGQSFMPTLGRETPGPDSLSWPVGEQFISDTPNLTSIAEAANMKWAEWIDPPPVQQGFVNCWSLPTTRTPIPTPDCWAPPQGSTGIGAWEGAFDYGSRIYRPAYNCILNEQTSVFEFCAVCRQALVSSFYAYESIPLFQVVSPAGTYVSPTAETTTFRIAKTLDHLTVKWRLDGALLQTSEVLQLDSCSMAPGTYLLEVEVSDETPWVRMDLYGAMQPQTHTWSIEIGGGLFGIVDVPSQVSFEEALVQAADGATIRLEAGTYPLAGLSVPCGRSYTIEGAGMGLTVLDADVDGDGEGDGRLLNIDGAGSVTLSDLTLVSGRQLGALGGAIHAQSSQQLTLERCQIAGSAALLGSALFALDTDVQVTNCLFTANTSSGGAGALFVQDGDLNLVNATFHANEGGAVDVRGLGAYTIRNCIFSQNGPFGVKSEEEAVVDWSLFWQQSSDVAGESYFGAGILVNDPLFVSTLGNDTLDWDLHLSSSSPAIDAGDPQDPFPEEPDPSGCAINLGAYGNTPEAQTSDIVAFLVRDDGHHVARGMTRLFEVEIVTPAGTSTCSPPAVWTLDPATGMGTITPAGLYSAPLVVTTGTVTVRATMGSYTDTATVTLVSNIVRHGDFDGDGQLTDVDWILLGNYVNGLGPWPGYREQGDADGDGDIDMADFDLLFDHVQSGGPPPDSTLYRNCTVPAAHPGDAFGNFPLDPWCP